jgi:DNA repair exonuclease SbcCD ATPase subunit
VDLSILKLVFFAEQYRAIDFVEVTDSVRVQMLSNLFGFSRLEKIRSELQKKASELSVDKVGDDVVSSLKSALESAEQRRDQLSMQQSTLTAKLLPADAVDRLRAVISSPDVGYYDNLESTITETQCEIDMAKAELSNMPPPISGDDAIKYSRKLRYDELVVKLQDLEAQRSCLEDSAGLSSKAIREFQSAIQQSMYQNSQEREELIRRSQLLQSGKCPLTSGVPCPDLVALTDQRQITDEIAEHDRKQIQLQADYDEILGELSKAEQHESQLLSITTNIASVSAELGNLSDVSDFDVEAHEARVASESQLSERRDYLQRSIAVGESKLQSLKAEYDSSKSAHPEEHSSNDKCEAEAKIAEHTSASDNLKLISTLFPEAEKAVSDSRSSLTFAEAQNIAADKNIHTRSIIDKVRNAFHRDNLPRLLVEDMLEILNGMLDKYLSRFSFPYKVVWASAGSLLYSDDLGQWHKASQLSGGQKYVLVIALRCALIDMLQSEFPLFVLDEPTTGLDVDNREALSAVLSAVVAANDDRILVVPTHDELLLPTANIINVGK